MRFRLLFLFSFEVTQSCTSLQRQRPETSSSPSAWPKDTGSAGDRRPSNASLAIRGKQCQKTTLKVNSTENLEMHPNVWSLEGSGAFSCCTPSPAELDHGGSVERNRPIIPPPPPAHPLPLASELGATFISGVHRLPRPSRQTPTSSD